MTPHPTTRPARIAIAHEFLTRYGGAERMVQAWAAMYPQAPVFTLFADTAAMPAFWHSVHPGRVRQSSLGRWQRVFKLLHVPGTLANAWRLPRYPQAIAQLSAQLQDDDYDLVISSSTAYMHGISTGSAAHVAYVHSPNRYAWDYTHRYGASWPAPARWLLQRVLMKHRLWDAAAAQQPRTLVAAASLPAARCAKFWRRPADHIIFPFVDTGFFTPAPGGPQGDYFLIYGQFTDYKRFDIAISAANRLGLKLVVIGHGRLAKQLRRQAGPTVEWLGAKYGEELREYIRHCRAFLMPGVEDFGMTVLEAMACGRPVVAVRQGGPTDSVIDGATGVLYDGETVEGLEKGLARFVAMEQGGAFRPDTIRQHAEQFSLRRFARQFHTLVEEKLAERGLHAPLPALLAEPEPVPAAAPTRAEAPAKRGRGRPRKQK